MAEVKLKAVIEAQNKAGKVFAAVEKQVGGLSKRLDKIGRDMSRIGKSVSIAAAPIGIAMGVGIKKAAAFEQSMSDVSTLISGDATEAIDNLSNGILEMTKTIPRSADELGASAYDILSAGIEGTSKQLEVLENAAKLGVAGLGSTKEATNLLTTAINAFGLEGRNSAEVADILFKTVKFGKTNISELSQAFGKMAGNAQAAGISFEDVQAATAAITALTGKTSEAQNALAQVFLELTQAGGKLDKALQEQGSSLEQLNTFIGDEGLVQGMRTAQLQMGLTETEFKNMFSSAEGGTVVFQLLTEAFDKNFKTSEDMLDGANALDDAFKKQKETAQAQYEVLKNNLNIALIELGTVIMPILLDISRQVIPKIQKLANWFKNLDDRTKKQIIAVGGLVLALGPALIIFGKMISALKTFISVIKLAKKAVIALNIATLPWLVTLSAIATAIYLVVDAFKKMNKAANDAERSAQKAFDLERKAVKRGIRIGGREGVRRTIRRRAGGGLVKEGTPYLVGEGGAELFIPSRSGKIIPNKDIVRGITVNFNNASVRNDNDLDFIIRAVKSTLSRDLVLRGLGA